MPEKIGPPQQPPNLDSERDQEHIETLELIEEQVKRWEAFRSDPEPWIDKIEAMLAKTRDDLRSLVSAGYPHGSPELRMLAEDAVDLIDLEKDPTNAEAVVDARIEYYHQLRQNFIKQL